MRFINESVLLWERRLADLGPDELRDARDALERRIEHWEEEAEEVLEEAGDLVCEISEYADLEEEESVRRLRRIVKGLPREMPLTPGGETLDLWEERKVFSEAAPGDRKQIERLAKRHSRFRRKVRKEKFSLRIVEHVHGQYLHGALKLGGGETQVGKTDDGPTETNAEHARTVLEATSGRDPTDFDRYADISRCLDRSGDTPEMILSTSVVDGAKRAANALGYNHDGGEELIRRLRDAADEGRI